MSSAKLQIELEKLRLFAKDAMEFIEDCSVSHNETRYKYKARVIQSKWKHIVEGENNE